MSLVNKFAIVSGGASGMGLHLVRHLLKRGASVAFCDISKDRVSGALGEAKKAGNGKVTGHVCDVGVESDWARFRSEVLEEHGAEREINMLFNNAGVGGGFSFMSSSRAEWDRTFNIDFFGVYYGCRTFIGDLVKAKEAKIVNTSSVNGFWAVSPIYPGGPQSAYATAKFAVRGFTESLLLDLRTHAPHVTAHLVMPGYIGTGIVGNASIVTGMEAAPPLQKAFVDNAPVSAEQAAVEILDGVEQGRWRILIGKDAEYVDGMVRAHPTTAYTEERIKEVGDTGFMIKLM
ncbi:hypothetical protein DFJ74DRAFT_769631 [Hyaloraphidium curvatum]|nr:hypothetical protein DFJ74DRAFT_769631 [Hyaloraphidium curvatum]